jgi:dihydroneopterin aldolase
MAQKGKYRLLETLGKAIGEEAARVFNLKCLKIKIKKPQALTDARATFFEWEQGRCGR